MSGNDDHRELVAVWKSLSGIVDGLRRRLLWGDSEYMDVTVMTRPDLRRCPHGSSALILYGAGLRPLWGPAWVFRRSAEVTIKEGSPGRSVQPGLALRARQAMRVQLAPVLRTWDRVPIGRVRAR